MRVKQIFFLLHLFLFSIIAVIIKINLYTKIIMQPMATHIKYMLYIVLIRNILNIKTNGGCVCYFEISKMNVL